MNEESLRTLLLHRQVKICWRWVSVKCEVAQYSSSALQKTMHHTLPGTNPQALWGYV